jgi:cell division protein FtsQ
MNHKSTRTATPRNARQRRASTSLVPVRDRRRQWIFTGAATAAILLGAGIFVFAGGPAWVHGESADATARAGFAITKIDIQGLKNTPRLAVHAALGANDGALLFTDLDDIRAKIELIPWVAHADVMRKLPDRLDVRIVERQPFAIWQNNGRLAVIDRQGLELTGQGIERFAQLPLVVGDGAARNAQAVFADIAVVPGLAHRVDSVMWIGQRRWDVRFKSGETLMLPEGRTAQLSALKAFAELQNGFQLLGRGKARFDMRLGDRMFVARVADEAGTQGTAKRRSGETSI